MSRRVTIKTTFPIKLTKQPTEQGTLITLYPASAELDPNGRPYPWFLKEGIEFCLDLKHSKMDLKEIDGAINLLTNIKKMMEDNNG